MLDSDICHNKAIELLKNARGHIELIVAKSKCDSTVKLTNNYQLSNALDNLTSVPIEKQLNDLNLSSTSINRLNDSKNDLELNKFARNEPGLDKFNQIELIELVNNGKGLGFGIMGGKTQGVVVKTILSGGVSDSVCRINFILLNFKFSYL